MATVAQAIRDCIGACSPSWMLSGRTLSADGSPGSAAVASSSGAAAEGYGSVAVSATHPTLQLLAAVPVASRASARDLLLGAFKTTLGEHLRVAATSGHAHGWPIPPTARPLTVQEFGVACTLAIPEVRLLMGPRVEVTAETAPAAAGSAAMPTPASLWAPLHPDSVEFFKAITGALLYWYASADMYEAWVACQPAAPARLSAAAWSEIVRATRRTEHLLFEFLTSRGVSESHARDEVYIAILTFIILNDIGKSTAVRDLLAAASAPALGHAIAMMPHDDVLLLLIKACPAALPSLHPDIVHPEVVRLMEFGLNTGYLPAQLVQMENVAGSMVRLSRRCIAQPRTFAQAGMALYMTHAFFDLASAQGHVNCHGSMVMAESTYLGYRLADETVGALAEQRAHNAPAISEQYWVKFAARRVSPIKIDVMVPDPVQRNFNRAKARLCCMARIFSVAEANLVDAVLSQQMVEPQRRLLVEHLVRDGIVGHDASQRAYLLYYGPALILNLLKQRDPLDPARRVPIPEANVALRSERYLMAFQMLYACYAVVEQVYVADPTWDSVGYANVALCQIGAIAKLVDTEIVGRGNQNFANEVAASPRKFLWVGGQPRLGELEILPVIEKATA